MRVVKPRSLGFLSRPFEFGGKIYCGFSVLAFIPLGSQRRLLSETGMWQLVADALGSEGVLDAAIPKRRGEFLVAGNAWPMPGTDKTKARVRVRFGAIEKVLNVFGDRSFRGEQISEPEPFESIPLAWESAFGGEGYSHNPLGKGFKPILNDAGQKVHPLPNVEYPSDMLGLPGQRPRPAAFGAVDGMWPERFRMVGTYGQDWLKKDYPGFAADIDWRYFNVASRDQQSDEVFRGDEPYLIEGMHPEIATIEGVLPGFAARCFLARSGSDTLEELSCNLTTVWFFPDREHAVMIYHACAEVEQPDAQDLAQVLIAADDISRPRPMTHYAEVLLRRLDEEKGTIESLIDDDLLPEGIDKGEGMDPDELLRGWSESIRAQHLRKRMEEAFEQGRIKLEAGLREIGVEPPPGPELPDFGVDPARLGELRIADMPELVDRLEKLAVESRIEMEAKAKESQQTYEQEMQRLRDVFPDSSVPSPNEGLGPPTFSAEEKEAEIREKLAAVKATGFDTTELDAGLLGDEMISLFKFSEEGMRQAYRMGASYQQPAEAKVDSIKLGVKLRAAVDAGSSFDAKDFTGASLVGADLSGVDLSGAFLESADLSDANLTGAKLDRAVLAHANLSGARMDGASLQKANLGKASMVGASAVGADFTGAILVEADLTRACLDDAILTEADLRDLRLSETSLAGACMEEYFLMDGSLGGVNFAGAKLDRAVFFNVDASEVDFSGASMHEAAFARCRGQGAKFDNADLTNIRIILQSDFSGSSFSSANLIGSCLRDALVNNAEFSKADLSKSDLSGIQGKGAIFYQAVLKGCLAVQADLREANLSGANLMAASLERADLRSASLQGANLFQADLARVHVDKQTNFDSALLKQMRTYPRKFPSER